MHDDAIERRTALRLQSETEEQAQALQDFKLRKEYERAEANRNLEKEQLIHRQEMETMQHNQKMEREKQNHNASVTQKKEMNEIELQFTRSLSVIAFLLFNFWYKKLIFILFLGYGT